MCFLCSVITFSYVDLTNSGQHTVLILSREREDIQASQAQDEAWIVSDQVVCVGIVGTVEVAMLPTPTRHCQQRV